MVPQFIFLMIGAYLLGSVPSAYLAMRWSRGVDIRQQGSGNVGASNVLSTGPKWLVVPVALFDIGKGAVSVVIANWLLDVPLYEINIFVLLAGLASVAGHMWSIYLKFTGGNGLAATIGVLAMLMPPALGIVLVIMLILTAITHNPVLSLNIGLLSLPASAWFLEKSWLPVIFSILLIAIMVINFIPTAMTALSKAGSGSNLTAELLRRNKT